MVFLIQIQLLIHFFRICLICIYLYILVLLILVSLRADDLVLEYFGSDSMRAYVIEKYTKQRGNPPTILEYAVLLYVIGNFFTLN